MHLTYAGAYDTAECRLASLATSEGVIMAQSLNDRIVEVLCEEWENVAPAVLESETVYERLIAEGETVPDRAMEELLEGLHESGLITAPGTFGREEIEKHGNRHITWVDAGLLCE